jgi:hypothetical protein
MSKYKIVKLPTELQTEIHDLIITYYRQKRFEKAFKYLEKNLKNAKQLNQDKQYILLKSHCRFLAMLKHHKEMFNTLK